MVYPYNPLHIMPGGGIRYVDLLLNNLLEKKVDASLMGVSFRDSSDNNTKIPLVPILNGSDNCWFFLMKLFLKVPFMKIDKQTIIHSHRSYFLLPFIFFKPHNPKIVTLHGITLEIIKTSKYSKYYSIINKLFRKLERFCLNHIDCHVAVSDSVRVFFENHYPFLENKIIVIPSGIDLNSFQNLNKDHLRVKYGFTTLDKIILFVGRLEKIKDIDFLIRSFKIMEKDIVNSKLLIVGEGIEKDNLKRLADELKLDNVIFMGNQKPENMPEIYNLANVLALCSQSEASPTVVKEAIACEVPVVTTRVGDVESIIVNKDIGRVVANKNEFEFANGIAEILTSNLMNFEIFNSVRKQFSFEYIADEYIRLYEHVNKLNDR